LANNTPFKITRPIFFLGLASFFTDASSEIVYPLLPIFLTSVLGATTMFVGVVEGVAESTAALTKYLFGWWSDRVGKRTRFVIGGYALANSVRSLIGLATSPGQVLALRFTDRIGKGMRTAPRDAWLAGLAPSEARGRAFGFHRAMDHAGAVTGPLLATGFLFLFPGQLRPLFLWSLAPGLVAILCVVAARWTGAPSAERPAAPAPEAAPRVPVPAALRPFLAILFIFTLAGSSDAFLLLRLNDVGVDARYIPLLWSALHVVKVVASVLGGRFADQVGRRTSIVAGWMWYGAIYAALGLVDSRAWAVGIFLAYGIYYGLTESAERALVADMVPPSARGRAFGLQNMVEGLGKLPASLLFGYLWKAFGATTAFGTSAAFAFIATVLLLLWRRPPANA
jgi:MFS family permease